MRVLAGRLGGHLRGGLQGALIAVLLGACAARRTVTTSEPGPLAAADAILAERADDPARIDVAIEALLVQDGRDPRVLSRLSHAWWLKSLADETTARASLEAGEEAGWACLLAQSQFRAATEQHGYTVDDDQAATLEREAVPCMVWTIVNTLDLVELRGPGGSLELRGVGPLVHRLRQLAPRAEGGIGAWAAARYRLMTTEPGDPSRLEARGELDEAIAANPTFLLFRVTYAGAFPDARAVIEDAPAPPEPDPWAFENGVARARLEKLQTAPAETR